MKTFQEALNELIEEMLFEQKQYRKAHEEFVQTLQENPLHALSWSQPQFSAAAHSAVWKDVISMFEKGNNLETILAYAERSLLDRAKWPTSSSSRTAVIAGEYVTAAWATMVERLRACKGGAK